MDSYIRVSKLISFIKNLIGDSCSKSRIHQYVFLAQQEGEDLDQDFTCHHYRVFSPSIEEDLLSAEQQKLILNDRDKKQVQLIVEKPLIHESFKFNPNTAELLKALIQKSDTELELISLSKFFKTKGYDNTEVRETLLTVYPNNESEIVSALEFVSRKELQLQTR